MQSCDIPLLGHALLGLLHGSSLSGYDVRKIFTETPMGSFSNSPGAIYPALERLEKAGLRSHLDDRKEKVQLKIREAQLQKIPYMLVVGDREAESGAVAVRHRKHGDMGAKPLEQFVTEVTNLVATKNVTE